MIAVSGIMLESCGRISQKQNFAITFGPYLKGLQSYMVRFGFLIAIILSPFRDQHCNHIWSSSVKLLHS